jgi:anion-transporting  ArsA/GET3 family ATPase
MAKSRAAGASPKRARQAPKLDALLAAKEMVLVCGSGGVGKTTIAAALGLGSAVTLGGKVLVLTVDPARRLADALGLRDHGVDRVGNTPTRVPDAAFAASGVQPRGELWVAMLDTKAGWDDLVRRHAPNAKTRDAVLANPLYENITSRFVHSHDYLAMEQLHEIHATGDFDLVVVDTPPSRNALDILDAPARMVEFFGSRLLKWLTVPYRSRLFNMASKPFNQIADRVLGSRFLQDIAEFFVLFQAMEGGFVKRAKEVEALLGDPRTTFVVVSTLEAAPAHEATYLARELAGRRYPLGAVVANRVLPPAMTAKAASASAKRLAAAVAEPDAAGAGEDASLAAAVTAALAGRGAPGVTVDGVRQVRQVLAAVAAQFPDVALVATREAERRAELAALAPQLVDVEALLSDVHDIAGLLAIAEQLVET